MEVLVGVGMIVCQPRDDCFDLCAGPGERGAGRQPSDRLQVAHAALRLLDDRRQLHEWNPEVVVERELHLRRHDADDGVDAIVDLERSSKHRAIGGVAAFPHAIAEDYDRFRAGDTSALSPERSQVYSLNIFSRSAAGGDISHAVRTERRIEGVSAGSQ